MKSISGCSKLLFFLVAASRLDAQTAFITGAGYSAPAPIPVAPGQIATFYVGGLPAGNVTANVTIAGVTVTAPVVATNAQSQATSAVTVQLPFTLAGASPYTVQFCSSGTCSAPVNLQQIPANTHIITTCDVFYANPVTPCQPAVTHQSGALVTPTAPAKAGEIVTLWAFGLGLPANGLPSTPGPVAMNDIVLTTEFVSEWFDSPVAPTAYLFAGLASSDAGLYQVNFAVPPVPAAMTACGTSGNMSISLSRTLGLSQLLTEFPAIGGIALVASGAFLTGTSNSICVVPAA